jgi:hypothetical protein
MTPSERVYSVLLHGEMPDKVPFTVYECMLQGFPYEKEILDMGACIAKRISSAAIHYPNIKFSSRSVKKDGADHIEHIIRTPYGDLTMLTQPAGFTSWTMEHMFKTPDDYKKLAFFYGDMVITENYGSPSELYRLDREHPNFVIRDDIGLEPMQRLIYDFGTEAFCYEWMDNRDELLKLYDILCEKMRHIYPITAKSPFRFHNYGGNVTPEVIGRDVFERYYLPVYAEACDVFHREGKKIGVHFDADNTTIMDLIGGTDLDYIEAYDITCSPPIEEAERYFKNKVLWLNWPSGRQLLPVEEIISTTKEIISSVKNRNRFIIGITEDIPYDIHKRNLAAILTAINEY